MVSFGMSDRPAASIVAASPSAIVRRVKKAEPMPHACVWSRAFGNSPRVARLHSNSRKSPACLLPQRDGGYPAQRYHKRRREIVSTGW